MPQPETQLLNLLVVVVVPQPEAQPLKKELVVVVVPQPEAQPLKVHPKTCHIWCLILNGGREPIDYFRVAVSFMLILHGGRAKWREKSMQMHFSL